jgi:UDP-N-acetylmuramate: L-alanyl-gamma-D-glutamyl-meso-diaminopimelate ligase
VVNARERALARVLARGCWTPVQPFGARKEEPGSLRARGEPHAFDVLRGSLLLGRVEWELSGEHNQLNALAAIGAAEAVGVSPEAACRALAEFRNVRRRLELRGDGGRRLGLRRLSRTTPRPSAPRWPVCAGASNPASASWRSSSRAPTP